MRVRGVRQIEGLIQDYGYGADYAGGTVSPELQLCAGAGYSDSCQGDSGGHDGGDDLEQQGGRIWIEEGTHGASGDRDAKDHHQPCDRCGGGAAPRITLVLNAER